MMYLRIPKDRIGVLIGKNGEVKRRIEEEGGVKIDIDSQSGEVVIDDTNAKDAFKAWRTRDVITAIGRGFSPDKAMKLFNEDYYLEIVDIKEFSGKSENRLRVLKGRVIGREGRTRKKIEESTGAYLSIYGSTVGIIGDYYSLESAKRAVIMLLSGRKHSTTYYYLERRRRELRAMELEMYEPMEEVE